MGKARLLLAEDDPITRQVIGMMLKHANFDHEIAENGQRAVEMWEKGTKSAASTRGWMLISLNRSTFRNALQ